MQNEDLSYLCLFLLLRGKSFLDNEDNVEKFRMRDGYRQFFGYIVKVFGFSYV